MAIYGEVGRERIWLGIREPGRLRVGQLLVHGQLVAHERRWLLEGTMRPSLSFLLNFSGFVLLSSVSVIAAAYVLVRRWPFDLGELMILLAPVGFGLLTWGLYKAVAAGARADAEILRRWLLAS